MSQTPERLLIRNDADTLTNSGTVTNSGTYNADVNLAGGSITNVGI
jgi:hypothetical protein